MHGVALRLALGENGIITKATKSSFFTEMQTINDQKEMSKTAVFMNQFSGSTEITSNFLGSSLEGNIDAIDGFSNTLKAEIIFARNNFGKGLMIDTRKIWKDNMYSCKDIFSDEELVRGISKDLYYISKDVGGEEEKYLYDSVTDVCYKIVDTNIASKIVHSLEYAKWILDGESMGGIGIAEDDAGTLESSSGILCYEPNLNNFSYKTEIIYYSQDLSKQKIITLKEYLQKNKPKTLDFEGETYIFADYSPERKYWANIKTNANGLDAYWVWIPRFAYKLDQETKKADIVFIDINNQPMNESDKENFSEYTVHPTFAENTTLKGIWFSKYNPSPIESVAIDSAEPEMPDFSNFDLSKTKLLYYTEDLKNTEEVNYSEELGQTLEKDGKTYYFYKYENKMWANIKTEANGLDAYWVWIPRFAYKLESGTSKVILVDTNNKPIDSGKYGNELPNGYKLHEAFEQSPGLKGMWFSKYNPSSVETVPIDKSEPQTPDLSHFSNSTKLIYYTEDLKNSTEVDFSTTPSQTIQKDGKTYYFYKYENKMWANIKTEANGLDAYWVWIPRFAYKLESGTANIILIGTDDKPLNKAVYGESLPSGYVVHEAFTQNGNLTGLWFSKYNPSQISE